ncbi:MAG: Gfo/Idh/MocA family oxidoreductase [Clostridiales bacterium]|nr:Gfo/Idh/MocA family oxidoreductase [Clostridiales bacterium]MCF8023522.1 Gfo/Idh/MocA family oxidoreductase [Clostridiales bacterium]
MRKLRVGIIGTGMALEKLHYPAFCELADKYEIAALCDDDLHRAQFWADKIGLYPENVYHDFQQVIQRPDIDVIDVLVPISKNFIVTEAAAAAGKPVICEKPMAPTPDQARKHAELPRKYGVPVMIAENYRYNEEPNILRNLVVSRKVGTPVYFTQNRVIFFPGDMYKDSFPSRDWRQHPDYPGGAIMDTSLHDLASLRHIFGGIDKLQAFGVPQDDEFAPYAVINVNMKFENGVTGNFNFFCAGKEMQRPLIGLRIFCTQGQIFLEERDCGTINVAYNNGENEQIPYRPQRGFYNELLNFYNAAIGQEELSVTPEIAYGDVKTVFDILHSIRTGQVIDVKRFNDHAPHQHRHFEEMPPVPPAHEPYFKQHYQHTYYPHHYGQGYHSPERN